ncbi:type II toxin-antitoxin system prevent-host-death family antitoxin [Leptolyngbya boryana CZ1]|jgi:prevent-host-death family protein|uniref:Antitoxin n=2 Tax=Leptolyngbya boryana TaxID=1184 RepID=A0A1Z4JDE4_LEPBY|nr:MULTISPECIES: type II toxin-antitoxin system prevent-host-death family antitoxin [Leptolyngbya]BAY54756.1 prevent-host-death family protein [Leptolyngbya boryana NIES-2135]MBD2365740.1 type II toxin-antitoxin system prevent-host-death family antitoxin [Leptolyngbya sp. FACHB-161]MBD2371920.1 type II toxin-antitoxin system prevent-host-death family antitoxin [Leptolyngbya sp. FACHB-238]MBD2396345.1 type II toxin-antitoxin system prevent-host-death family antitoxin [Leptolyngbya sp. FACHB-239]
MQQYSIEEMRERSQDVLDSATSEPVILVNQSRPSYVVLSVQNYQQLIDRLTELEDRALGKQAETALQNSSLIGTETFVTELQQLANLDDRDQ